MTSLPEKLPDNPNREHLKGEAKTLLRRLEVDNPDTTLANAQLLTARKYGFRSWPALSAHLDVLEKYSRQPAPVAIDSANNLADVFLSCVCLNYTEDNSENAERAAELLAVHRGSWLSNVHVCAALGDATALRAIISRNPLEANVLGGPWNLTPLCYLAYSRVSEGSPTDAARVLLSAGADPNAGFLWNGLPSPFTVLTGVFGGGEQAQSHHPQAQDLARLILDAGADPNDNQALYNRMFVPADDHLELLFEFGLGTEVPSPWREKLGDSIPSPTAMLEEQLRWAADHNMTRRVRLLLEHGVEPDGLGYHPVYRSRTAYQLAMAAGNIEIADTLVAFGAVPAKQSPANKLLTAAMAGDRDRVNELMLQYPDSAADLLRRKPDVVVRAARTGRLEAVTLMVALGGNIDATAPKGHRESALHVAVAEDYPHIARYLIDRGADTTIRDGSFDGTPLGWAEHLGHLEIAEALRSVADGA